MTNVQINHHSSCQLHRGEIYVQLKKHIALKEKSLINELEPGHIDYLPLDAVGSGSYGQCHRAHYMGINRCCQEDDKQGYRRGQVKGEA